MYIYSAPERKKMNFFKRGRDRPSESEEKTQNENKITERGGEIFSCCTQSVGLYDVGYQVPRPLE